MASLQKHILLTLLALTVYYYNTALSQQITKAAFISDIHIHNIYPDTKTDQLNYFYDSAAGKAVLIRTLESEMNSTRLFNENYFALQQALDDIAKQDIKLVIIPGDYSDDGQLMNLIAVKDMLSFYQQKFQIRFLLTNGNHDAEPFSIEGGKRDFLGPDGKPICVYSADALKRNPTDQVYPLLKVGGYEAVFGILKNFGFLPSPKDLFYNTPHHPMNYDTYVFDSSLFSFKTRWYHYQNDSLPDLTYLVEPVKDLWVMAIDGNIFEKRANQSFENIGDGYEFLDRKPFLLAWIKQVVAAAKLKGKTLIAFSHYPMLDFNNGLSEQLAEVLGKNNFQLPRVPTTIAQNRLLESGLQVHFAGHMHINQHGNLTNNKGQQLWNIQVPSLAAFPPAYKIANISKKKISITTHALNHVKDYNKLFAFYTREQKSEKLSEILNHSPNYYSFTKNHLNYLAVNRFYYGDFKDKKWDEYKNNNSEYWPLGSVKSLLGKNDYQTLINTGFQDIVFDLYLVRNGNDLGIKEIPKARLKLYRKWASLAKTNANNTAINELIILLQQLIDNSLPTKKTVIQFSQN